MTLRKLWGLAGRFTLVCFLVATSMALLLRRITDSTGSWADRLVGLFLDPLVVACCLVTLVAVPLWLLSKAPRVRERLGGWLTGVAWFNGAVAVLVWFAPLPPVAGPAPNIALVAPSPPLPIRVSRPSFPSLRPEPPVLTAVSEKPFKTSPTRGDRETQVSLSSQPLEKVQETPSPAPPEPFAAIDAYALAAPAKVESDVATLARYLVAPAKNDREKIRAIYRWTCDRIAYDAESYFAKSYPDQSAEATLKTRLSVCAGYANLVHALGQAAGLETRVVGGDSRTAVGEASTEGEPHAWNAVKLDGTWHLLDSTWGAGHVEESRTFTKAYDDAYFLGEPTMFAFTHRPDEAKWQLLEAPLTAEQFRRQPLLHPRFFRSHMRLETKVSGALKADPGVEITLTVPSTVSLVAELESADGVARQGATRVERHGDRARILVRSPERGTSTLVLYAGAGKQHEPLEGAAEFQVQAASGDPDGFPEISPTLGERQGKIVLPDTGVISPGRQNFELLVPGAQGVFVDQWDQPLRDLGQGRFAGDVDVRIGECRVYAHLSGGQAEQVAAYRVRYRRVGSETPGAR